MVGSETKGKLLVFGFDASFSYGMKHDDASGIGIGKGFRLQKANKRWTTNISYSWWQIFVWNCCSTLRHHGKVKILSLGVLEMEIQWNLLSTWWWEVWWPFFLKVGSRWESGIEARCYCWGNITGSYKCINVFNERSFKGEIPLPNCISLKVSTKRPQACLRISRICFLAYSNYNSYKTTINSSNNTYQHLFTVGILSLSLAWHAWHTSPPCSRTPTICSPTTIPHHHATALNRMLTYTSPPCSCTPPHVAHIQLKASLQPICNSKSQSGHLLVSHAVATFHSFVCFLFYFILF